MNQENTAPTAEAARAHRRLWWLAGVDLPLLIIALVAYHFYARPGPLEGNGWMMVIVVVAVIGIAGVLLVRALALRTIRATRR
jgi:hypothetical protein